MPTPLELILDPVSLAFFAIYGGLMLWEALAPGRALPRTPGWRLRSLAVFAAYFLLSSYLPLLWTGYLAPYQLLDLSWMGTVGGTIAGLLVLQAGTYAWHRALHGSDLLWRGFHQMHHSAERLETLGAFYFSPLDTLGWTALGSLCLTLGVGVTPQAATAILLIGGFLSTFQHANIRTPRWLGYLVQRPESHTIHHGRGLHRYNYGDLPLFDILFGTFRNPAAFERETGFYAGASARIGEMLLWRDVTRPETTEDVSPAKARAA